MTALLVAVGGAVGAVLRLLVSRAAPARLGEHVPWGTLAVNVVGSLVLGLLVGAASVSPVPDDLVTALGVGLCAAFTTWSTAAWDAVVLATRDGGRLALLWTAGEVTAGLLAAAGGWAVAAALLAT